MSGEGSGLKKNPEVPTNPGSKKPDRRQEDLNSDDSDNGTLTNSNYDETLYQQPVETDEHRLQDPDIDEFVNNTREWLKRNEHAVAIQIFRDFQNYGSITRSPYDRSGNWSNCRRLMKLLILLAIFALLVFSIIMIIYFAVRYFEI